MIEFHGLSLFCITLSKHWHPANSAIAGLRHLWHSKRTFGRSSHAFLEAILTAKKQHSLCATAQIFHDFEQCLLFSIFYLNLAVLDRVLCPEYG
jgi:hypothetical protein